MIVFHFWRRIRMGSIVTERFCGRFAGLPALCGAGDCDEVGCIVRESLSAHSIKIIYEFIL